MSTHGCASHRAGGLGDQRRAAERRPGRFFHGAGRPSWRGGGHHEAPGGAADSRPARRCPAAVRAAADGEIEVGGREVLPGHWQDERASGAADPSTVTGGKKGMLITVRSQHAVPSVLEDKVRERWLIAECVAAGERRPYVAALIALDGSAFARVEAAARQAGRRDHRRTARRSGSARCRPAGRGPGDTRVSRPETIKWFRILDGPFQVAPS